MPTRLTLFIAATIAIACSLVWPPSALAQVDRVADPTWTTPRTADGQPDLQGLWGNKTITPTERPDSAGGRAFLTDEEMAAASRQRIAALEAQDEAPARRTEAGGGIGAYGSYWLDSGDTVLSTGQTSLIVDPPDGRAPIQAWALETKAYNLAHEGDHYRHLSTLDRCLSRGVPGSMLPAGYNNTHRIVQTPDHVVIQHEMIHDLRIIPLSDHAHVDDRIGLWMGDARARWDGEVLVVETRNFHNRGWIATSFAGGRLKGIPTSSALHVVERYERVSETTIMLTVTVDDPNVYTRPWTISMPLTAEPDYVIYEYACHEGNYAIPNILAGARKADAVAAQDGAKDYPQWRGRARDGSASAFVAPARWPETLTWRWATDVGEGYATPLVVGETVYTFTRQNDDEVATALDATTGDVVWRTAYPAPYEMFSGTAHHGAGPKATPLFHDGRLYTHGISGAVSAFDGATGDIVWQIPAPDIQPLFGTAISPLADGDRVIVHPGYAPLTALDARTGNVVWATGDQGVWASPIITQLDGVRQVVSVAYQVIEGVGLTDGAVLWQYPIDPEMVHAVTPLAYDGMVLLSGQDSGVKALRPLRRDGTWEVELAWEAPEVSMDLSNPVLIGDALFGLSHRSSGQYFVIDARTGDVEWLGEPRAAQNTAVVKADDLLFLLNDDAELIVGRIGRAGLERIRGYTVADSATWAQPAISGNRLFIKDIDTVALWTVD